MIGNRLVLAAGLLGGAVLAAACGGEGRDAGSARPPSTPEALVEQVSLLAGDTTADEDRLAALFEPDPSDPDWVALRELLGSLEPGGHWSVVAARTVDREERALDLRSARPGDGVARLSLYVKRSPEDGWKVRALLAPEGSWPPRPPEPDEGVSVVYPGT